MRFTEYSAFILRRILGPALKQMPVTRVAVRTAMNGLFRVALLPFGRNRRRGVPRESAELVARTPELNAAAERYFVLNTYREFLLGKPFTDAVHFPRHLFHLAVVLEALRLRREDVVLELGAGTCWVSHFLNRYGCRTISVDVSPTALALGRELFQRDPSTNWSVTPEFLTYDGYRIPVADGSVDKVIIIDAFHHVPNQRQILTELHRILSPDGMVGMSEPGKGHADTEASRQEMEQFGVLENELVIEDLGALAKACGFADAVVLASPSAMWEIPTDDLGPFMQGKGFTQYWEHQCDALLASHHILLYKGDPRPTTRQPKVLHSRIAARTGKRPLQMARGHPYQLRLTVTNTAATRWLAHGEPGAGWTRLGAHLYRLEPQPRLVDFDWLRVALPHDVAQYQRLRLDVTLPALDQPGRYRVVFDMVVEGVTWFAARGSPATALEIQVLD
jgi:SAM-dependent methyltransferase